ncbi:acetylxylan esterase [soil metagenome]
MTRRAYKEPRVILVLSEVPAVKHLALLLLFTTPLMAQPKLFPPDPEMPAVKLPDLLAGTTTTEQWQSKRRPEVLELFRTHVYGRVPATKYEQAYKVVKEDKAALDGKATLKEVDIVISRGGKSLTIRLNVFTPNAAKGPVPAFLLICNRGKTAADPTRLQKAEFWPVEEGIARGFAMAAFLNSDVDPDKDDGFKDGIHGLLDVEPRTDSSWGTLAAWAWGASRCLDYLVTDPAIAKDNVAVIGHSRGGKTALWAGAEDQRFALTISNDSGCGGAGISRRKFEGKEQIARITKSFPHWFCGKYKSYGDNEDASPVDQHMLLALIAPRAVAVGSAFDDKWADPRGEFLSLVHAEPAFKLLGKQSLGTAVMPVVNNPLNSDVMHYHIRPGKHDLMLSDWTMYWDFADKVFRK